MSFLKSDIKIEEFPHFQIYYDKWRDSFNKPGDLLVLFNHWLLIHNRFRCSTDAEATDYLPSNWNLAKHYYDLVYIKHGSTYRLEVYLIGSNSINIQFKRLSDSKDYLQYLKINEFVNVDDYKNPKYQLAYKNLNEYVRRIQFTIQTVKHKKLKSKDDKTESKTPISITEQSSNQGNNNFLKPVLKTDPKSSSTSSYSSNLSTLSHYDLCLAIKKEKEELDSELESLRRNSICSMSSMASTFSKEMENQQKLKNKALNISNYYVNNPISNYFLYNSNIDPSQSVDQNSIKNNEFVKECFEKYDLKICQINVSDCFKSGGAFQNLDAPFVLSKEMKDSINLANKNKNSNNTKYDRKEQRNKVNLKNQSRQKSNQKRKRNNSTFGNMKRRGGSNTGKSNSMKKRDSNSEIQMALGETVKNVANFADGEDGDDEADEPEKNHDSNSNSNSNDSNSNSNDSNSTIQLINQENHVLDSNSNSNFTDQSSSKHINSEISRFQAQNITIDELTSSKSSTLPDLDFTINKGKTENKDMSLKYNTENTDNNYIENNKIKNDLKIRTDFSGVFENLIKTVAHTEKFVKDTDTPNYDSSKENNNEKTNELDFSINLEDRPAKRTRLEEIQSSVKKKQYANMSPSKSTIKSLNNSSITITVKSPLKIRNPLVTKSVSEEVSSSPSKLDQKSINYLLNYSFTGSSDGKIKNKEENECIDNRKTPGKGINKVKTTPGASGTKKTPLGKGKKTPNKNKTPGSGPTISEIFARQKEANRNKLCGVILTPTKTKMLNSNKLNMSNSPLTRQQTKLNSIHSLDHSYSYQAPSKIFNQSKNKAQINDDNLVSDDADSFELPYI